MSPSGAAPALSLPQEIVGSLTRANALREAGARSWPLGWPELDATLRGGVPRGQVTEWAGPRSAGKTAALRQMIWAVHGAGVGAAFVDGTRTLAPAPWVREGSPLFWVVRPPAMDGVLPAVEELLRSGIFGLVVAEGGEWSRTPVIRLQRLARGTGAALIAVVDRPGRVPLAGLRIRFAPDLTSRSYRVQVWGRGTAAAVSYAYDLPYRLPKDCGLPDRRGASCERRAKPRRR